MYPAVSKIVKIAGLYQHVVILQQGVYSFFGVRHNRIPACFYI